MRILSMKCANCSAPLQIKPETTEFVCSYCGSAQIVDRSGGAVTLNLVAETLGRVQLGTDRTASELALVRLKKELMCFSYPPQECKPRRPSEPEGMKRPVAESFLERLDLGGLFVSAEFRRLNRETKKMLDSGIQFIWDQYDRSMAAYEKEMLDWPAKQKLNEKVSAEYAAKRKAIMAEIAVHEAIVNRT